VGHLVAEVGAVLTGVVESHTDLAHLRATGEHHGFTRIHRDALIQGHHVVAQGSVRLQAVIVALL